MKRTFVLLLALLPMAAMAQTGSITGTIMDENSGEPLIGASAIILGTMTGSSTNIDGKFVIDSLAPGEYTIRATYIGFHADTVRVRVMKGEVSTLEIRLTDLPPIPYDHFQLCPVLISHSPNYIYVLGSSDPIMQLNGIGPWD